MRHRRVTFSGPVPERVTENGGQGYVREDGRMAIVDVSVEPEDDGFAVKLSSEAWELNVRATLEDLQRLAKIRGAAWSDRRSIEVGSSAGGRVFWASAGGTER